ncbi:hypothetical protein [Streptomyces sp. NPDC051776]|uniref:hypothetical protein n=1 Tax=Streptomyces sp. NPDC051776 TaxID=3155414 RepID=UPI00341FD367
MYHGTPPARRRTAAVVTGLLLALAALLVGRPGATAALRHEPLPAAVTAVTVTGVTAVTAVSAVTAVTAVSAVTAQQDIHTPAGAVAADRDLPGARTGTPAPSYAATVSPTSSAAVFAPSSGGDAPGCRDDRRDDEGTQPSVPPRTGPSYDHGPLLAERAVPGDRAVPRVLLSHPAVPGPPLPPRTPVTLSVVQRV